MFEKVLAKRIAIIAIAITVAAALKYHYSTATANGLRWVLAPTATLVDLLSSNSFRFESYAGYLSDDHSYLIAASCSGMNFLIIAFVMLVAVGLLADYWKWRLIPFAFGASYIATIIANTVRITTDLSTRELAANYYGLSAENIHRVEGIVIYFGFLIVLFFLGEIFFRRCRFDEIIRRLPLPLAIYYATAFVIPLVNGAWDDPAFWTHSIFVLTVPFVIVLLIVLLGPGRTSDRQIFFRRR
ncbi:MAG TPA: exosortase K [Pyrinomonadaceae bacterium]